MRAYEVDAEDVQNPGEDVHRQRRVVSVGEKRGEWTSLSSRDRIANCPIDTV